MVRIGFRAAAVGSWGGGGREFEDERPMEGHKKILEAVVSGQLALLGLGVTSVNTELHVMVFTNMAYRLKDVSVSISYDIIVKDSEIPTA